MRDRAGDASDTLVISMKAPTATSIGDERFTLLFERARTGDRLAGNLVYELAFPRLRQIASALLRRHRSHFTMQPTALVSELCLKVHCFELRIFGREHFFRVSARAMRQVLADRGSSQSIRKSKDAELWEALARERIPADAESVQMVRESLARFERIDRKAARVLCLRYVEGHTWEEIARLIGREVWRVREDAAFALRWMRDNLS